MWQYLAEQVGVELEYTYLTPDQYAAGLASGNLPDIVTAQRKRFSSFSTKGGCPATGQPPQSVDKAHGMHRRAVPGAFRPGLL